MTLLAEVADIQTGPFGSQLHKKDYVASGRPIVTVEHLGKRAFTRQNLPFVSEFDAERLKKYQMKHGDVIFSRVGSVDRCSYAEKRNEGWLFSGRCLRIRPKKSIDPEFLYYYLSSKAIKGFVRNIAVGATMPSINTTLMGEIPIPAISLDRQRAIACIMSSLDIKLQANAKLNGYLEELCDALFLDFLERADSSWHEGTLEELAEVKYGKNHKKLADGPYPVYGSGGFMRSAEKSLFSGESVLIPRKGSLNNVMYVNEAFWTVDTMFFTVPRIPGAAKFLYQYVKRLDLASMNSGSAVPSMTTSILNALSLPVPPRDSLLSFNAKLQSMYDAVRANNLENRRLESLRDSLLPKLMTGEIDVSKIDLTQLNSHLA